MKIKNMNELSRIVTKREGGRINLSIAQVKEVLAHMSDLMFEQKKKEKPTISEMLLKNGKRRSYKK